MAAPYVSATQSRLDEEITCLKTIAQCLESSFRYHSSASPLHAAPNTTTVEETCEFFELIVSLLSADSSPQRLNILVFDLQPSILNLLMALLEAPTPSYQRGNPSYTECKVLCVQTVTKIISMCTEDATVGVLGDKCVAAVAHSTFLRTAMMHLSPEGLPDSNEAVRVSFAECLFVLVMRVEPLIPMLIQEDAVKMTFGCLFSDPAVMVRNYACAIMRVLAEKVPDQFITLPIVEKSLAQIQAEHSKYVVILLFETMSILFYACPQMYLQSVHDDTRLLPQLAHVIDTFLTGNTNYDVLTAVVKVLEAMLLLESTTCGGKCNYTVQLLTQGGPKSLLQRDQSPDDVRYIKVKTLRKLIQACTSSGLNEELHEAYTHFFPSLSLLLNADGSGVEKASVEVRGELALCFALILAKNPRSREYTSQTVSAYPVWIGQLRQHLLSATDEMSPPMLNGVHIVDSRDVYLNNIHSHHAVNWTDRMGLAQLVSRLMHDQETLPKPPATQHVFVEEAMTALPGQLSDMDRKARLTHTILSHVIHAALAVDGVVGQVGVGVRPPFLTHGVGSGVGPSPFPVQQTQQTGNLVVGDGMYYSEPGMSELQNYPSFRKEEPVVNNMGQASTPSARGRENDRKLRKLFGRSKSPTTSVRVAEKRPPWNGGGNSGKKALFSAPMVGKRTEFLQPASTTIPTPRRKQLKQADPVIDTDYTDMAILMHLPITFGANYNKSNKPTTRRFNNGASQPYVQQTMKSTTLQSWDVKDVGEGELFSFFIPFHKLGVERIDEEIKNLTRHKTKAKKGLIMTPSGQKGKRWFFYDLSHYILPKTETLLFELRDLVAVHGPPNILFYLNIIKLMEDKNCAEAQELLKDNPHIRSPPRTHLALGMVSERESLLQKEVLKLSDGKYKETIHGGNILYVLDRLKAYFAENFSKGELQLTDHLKGIEDEITKLEERAARDVIGNEAVAEAEDDIESAYDSSDTEAMLSGIGAPPPPAAAARPYDAYADPAFSTETESDVNYNLDHLGYGDTLSYSAPASSRQVSPSRPNAYLPPANDDWPSEASTLSF